MTANYAQEMEMNEEEKIQLAIDRIDRMAEILVNLVATGHRIGGMGNVSVLTCRPLGVCSLVSDLKYTSRLLATIGKD